HELRRLPYDLNGRLSEIPAQAGTSSCSSKIRTSAGIPATFSRSSLQRANGRYTIPLHDILSPHSFA
ncbi:MAG: hypothetical protein P8Y36_05045, partial [Alphaproteobacteria bacterium]